MYEFPKFRNFCQQTTINGLSQIIGRNSKTSKIVWLLCFLTSLAFGIAQIRATMSTYLLYQSTTKVMNLVYEEMHFPAITLCPMSVYRKSIVGSMAHLYTGAYLSTYGGYDNVAGASRASERLCGDPSAKPLPEFQWRMIEQYHLLFFDSGNSVMECRFNRNPLNCTRLFLNKQTELGWCFTFNTGIDLLQSFLIEGESNKPDSYGTTVSEKKEFLMQSGMENSLTFTLNANVSDVCIPVDQYMVGFVAYVHDPNIGPFLTSKPLILLSPGFSTKIGIKVKKIKRNTENLGFCQSKIRLKWYPNLTEYTARDTYILDCMTTLVFEICKCLPFFAPPQAGRVENITWQQYVCGSTQVFI